LLYNALGLLKEIDVKQGLIPPSALTDWMSFVDSHITDAQKAEAKAKADEAAKVADEAKRKDAQEAELARQKAEAAQKKAASEHKQGEGK
jgi:hypothetical protein